MSLSDISGWIYPVLFILGMGVVYVVTRGTLSKENENIKDDLIDSRGKKISDLEKEVVDLKRRDNEQQVMIDKLMSEVEIWKNLPIRQLSEDYHNLAVAVSDMSKVLKALAEKQDVKSDQRRTRTTNK